jgi:hypothetical protein
MSLSCKCVCQQSSFKERFKVLKQLSGKIIWSIRRWYRYCSTCSVWIRSRSWGLCQCCAKKLRANKKSRIERNRRYYQNHKESCKARSKAWEEANKERRREYKRRYALSKKKPKRIFSPEHIEKLKQSGVERAHKQVLEYLQS